MDGYLKYGSNTMKKHLDEANNIYRKNNQWVSPNELSNSDSEWDIFIQ